MRRFNSTDMQCDDEYLICLITVIYYSFLFVISSLLSHILRSYLIVYMYILLFICFHVLYVSFYMFRGPRGRLAKRANVSPS